MRSCTGLVWTFEWMSLSHCNWLRADTVRRVATPATTGHWQCQTAAWVGGLRARDAFKRLRRDADCGLALDVPTSPLLTGLQTGVADFIYLLWNCVTICNTVKKHEWLIGICQSISWFLFDFGNLWKVKHLCFEQDQPQTTTVQFEPLTGQKSMEYSGQLSLADNGEPGNMKFTKYTHARAYSHARRKKPAQNCSWRSALGTIYLYCTWLHVRK